MSYLTNRKRVIEAVNFRRNTIDILWKDGVYIAAPTHDVPFDVPVENLIAMIDVFENTIHN